MLSTDAQLRVGGAGDLRFTSKVTTIATPHTPQGHSSSFIFTIYNSSMGSVPIIRNEELILLRAEANMGIGGAANLTAARTDIDLIGVNAGAATQATLRTELLYNKRTR